MTKTPWLFTAVIFLALLLPEMVQQGMFLDGITYGAVARNMAEGQGTFAAPFYTSSLYPVFHEQPPLAIWLQSGFFRVFGDHFWVEKLYSMVLALCVAGFITLNWRELAQISCNEKKQPDSEAGWLPVLIWVSMPITFWAFKNNMLECTQSLLVLIASFASIRHFNSRKSGWQLVAMAAIAGAVLSKGPVGFFPVVVPVLLALSQQGKMQVKGMVDSAVLAVGAFTLLGLIIVLLPGMSNYLSEYWSTRLLPTMSGVREGMSGSRFHFLADVCSQQIVPAAILLMAGGFYFWKNLPNPNRKNAVFCFLTGIFGTFPLVLSPKQSSHYLLPALPFFALGFAFLIAPHWCRISDQIGNQGQRFLQFAAVFSLVGVLVWSFLRFGKYSRDEALISDIRQMATETSGVNTVSAPLSFSDHWLPIACMMRIGRLSLDYHTAGAYFLTEKSGNLPDSLQSAYQLTSNQLQNFNLYRRK